MKNCFSVYFAAWLCAGLLAVSCSKPTLVGSDLLDDEKNALAFVDTMNLRFITEEEDSVVAFKNIVQFSRYLCGNLDDPIFGYTSSELFFQYRQAGFATELMGSIIDSIVLRFSYDTSGVLARYQEEVTVEVYEVTEDMDFDETYYTSQSFETGAMPIGSKTFITNFEDSVSVVIEGDTIGGPPLMQIKLDDPMFAARFSEVTDSSVYQTITDFKEMFKGLALKMVAGSSTMLAFNLSSEYSSMQIYFRKDDEPDTEQQVIDFIVDPTLDVKTAHYTHTYAGAPIEAFIDNEALCDSIAFIQAMGGVNTKFSIDGIESLSDDYLINYAELIIHALELPDTEDDTLLSYNPINQLVTKVADENGNLVDSRDLDFNLRIFGEPDRMGGEFVPPDYANNIPGRYVINTTAQMQAIARGEAENAIYLSAFVKQIHANRTIIYGPGHSQYPAKLRLTLTKKDE